MINLEKIFGSDRYEEINKLVINPTKVTIFDSIIIRKDVNDPIYLSHMNLPELIEDDSELIPGFLFSPEEGTDDYVIGDCYWDTIDYTNIVFSDLTPEENIGDVVLITSDGIFELSNVSIDYDEKRVFYDEATELNNY